eukprot:Pgem_evm1s18925
MMFSLIAVLVLTMAVSPSSGQIGMISSKKSKKFNCNWENINTGECETCSKFFDKDAKGECTCYKENIFRDAGYPEGACIDFDNVTCTCKDCGPFARFKEEYVAFGKLANIGVCVCNTTALYEMGCKKHRYAYNRTTCQCRECERGKILNEAATKCTPCSTI